MSANSRFISLRTNRPNEGKRSYLPSPLGKIAAISSDRIESLKVAPSRSFFDTGAPQGLGYADSDGNVYLTVAAHGEDLFSTKKVSILSVGESFIRKVKSTKITKLNISSPLLAVGRVRDSIDLIEGKVYRSIASLPLGEETEIREVYYCGFKCFAVRMPEGAKDSCYIGRLKSVTLDELSERGEGIIISHDCRTAYIHLGGRTTLSEARDFLLGRSIVCPLRRVREEQLSENLKASIDEGARYIEICADTAPVFLTTYKKGERYVRENK